MCKLFFNSCGLKILFKRLYFKFVDSHKYSTHLSDQIISYARSYGILMAIDLDQYERGDASWSRVAIVSSLRMMTLLTSLRFFISSLSSDESVHRLATDPNYLLGNRSLISMLISLGSVIILCISLVIQYQEMTRSFSLLAFFIKYKHQKIVSLKVHSRRYQFIANLFVRCIIRPAFWSLVVITSIGLLTPGFIAYLDTESHYSLLLTIFWNVCLFVWITQFYAIVSVGFVAWMLSAIYLKYKFREIATKLQYLARFQPKSDLMDEIIEHDLTAKETECLNYFISKMIFILYYFASPSLMICMYLVHAEDTHLYMRYVFGFVFTIVYLAVFLVNLFSSHVSHNAMKPRTVLFRYFSDPNLCLALRRKLKIMGFIEKLSGPEIGFYCLDLFSMNNNRFQKYVANCAAMYFLILGLLKQ